MSLSIDFTHPKLCYRLTHGGGKSQMIAKACGLQQLKSPRIIDACAGFGTDGLVLASLGAEVIMMERNPLVFEALSSAYTQALSHPLVGPILTRVTLLSGDAQTLIPHYPADIIYLDPMFPPSAKSALHQKNLQILHDIVGFDDDGSNVLSVAIPHATYRTVVKRPRLAPALLATTQPDCIFSGKANRFDVYVNRSIHHRYTS